MDVCNEWTKKAGTFILKRNRWSVLLSFQNPGRVQSLPWEGGPKRYFQAQLEGVWWDLTTKMGGNPVLNDKDGALAQVVSKCGERLTFWGWPIYRPQGRNKGAQWRASHSSRQTPCFLQVSCVSHGQSWRSPSPWTWTGGPERPTPGPALLRAGPGWCLGSPEASMGQTRTDSGLLEQTATLECTTTQCWGPEQFLLGQKDSQPTSEPHPPSSSSNHHLVITLSSQGLQDAGGQCISMGFGGRTRSDLP